MEHIPLEAQNRLWGRVVKGPGCWVNPNTSYPGYPKMSIRGRQWVASRVAWSIVNGPIPNGMIVCHHCDNPKCIRPEHLFLGTEKDNAQDKIRKKRDAESRKTHCPKGHPYSGENLYTDPNGHRECKSCRKTHMDSFMEKFGSNRGYWKSRGKKFVRKERCTAKHYT